MDYGPMPVECIDAIKDLKIPTIRGNHDNAVAYRIDCGCGYEYKNLSISSREYTWQHLDQEHIHFLKNLPLNLKENIDGHRLYFTHGSPVSMYNYIKPDTPVNEIEKMIEGIDSDFLFIGHSHIPFVRKVKNTTIINPGSVGQPRDGDIRASCAVFDTVSCETEIIRLQYDIKGIYRLIRDKNMPDQDQLIDILKRGY